MKQKNLTEERKEEKLSGNNLDSSLSRNTTKENLFSSDRQQEREKTRNIIEGKRKQIDSMENVTDGENDQRQKEQADIRKIETLSAEESVERLMNVASQESPEKALGLAEKLDSNYILSETYSRIIANDI